MNKQFFEDMRSQAELTDNSVSKLKLAISNSEKPVSKSMTLNLVAIGVCTAFALIIGGTFALEKFAAPVPEEDFIAEVVAESQNNEPVAKTSAVREENFVADVAAIPDETAADSYVAEVYVTEVSIDFSQDRSPDRGRVASGYYTSIVVPEKICVETCYLTLEQVKELVIQLNDVFDYDYTLSIDHPCGCPIGYTIYEDGGKEVIFYKPSTVIEIEEGVFAVEPCAPQYIIEFNEKDEIIALAEKRN